MHKLKRHIDNVASAGRPALTSGSYIRGLPLFSCLVLDGLTSFSVFISSTGRSDIIQSFSERCVVELGSGD